MYSSSIAPSFGSATSSNPFSPMSAFSGGAPFNHGHYSSPPPLSTTGAPMGSPLRKTNDPYAVSVTPPSLPAAATAADATTAAAGGMGTGTPSNLSFDAAHLIGSLTPPASPLLTPPLLGSAQAVPPMMTTGGGAFNFAHPMQQQQDFASAAYAQGGNGGDALLLAALQLQQQQQQQLAMLAAAATNPAAQQILANALLFSQQQQGGALGGAPADPNLMMLLLLQQQQQQQAAAATALMQQQQQQLQYVSVGRAAGAPPQSYLFGAAGDDMFAPHMNVDASSSSASAGARGNHHQHQQQQGGNSSNASNGGASSTAPMTLEALRAMSAGGSLCDVARTPNGSSMVQNAIKERSAAGAEGQAALLFILQELYPQLGDLLLDAHGCYVVKTLIDHLPLPQLQQLLADIAADEPLAFSLCTHSLHTRRVVQHVMEQYDGHFLIDMLTRRCAEVAMTQQGCIVLQRAMDRSVGPQREALYAAVHKNFLLFCRDAFANYVVQHLLEVGNRETNSAVVSAALQGRVVELSCNKFASNVVEKCLFHVTAEVQHQILVEMYTSGEQTLNHMLQDSFGNYIIQSSIALATFRDVWFINEHLRPVLRLTPYGHKIEARLDRRMKGKAVQARQQQPHHGGGGSQVGSADAPLASESATTASSGAATSSSNAPTGRGAGTRHAGSAARGRGGNGGAASGSRGGKNTAAATVDIAQQPMVPANEEPW